MIRQKAVLLLASAAIASGSLFAAGHAFPGALTAVYEFKAVNSDEVKHLLSAHIVVPDRETYEGTRRVSEGSTFYSYERFRLALQPKMSGHIYVFGRNNDGDVELLYPRRTDGDNYVSRNSKVSLPYNGWFRFDRVPGQEELFIVQSPTPLADVEDAMTYDDGDYARLLHRYERYTGERVLVRRMFLEHEPR